MTVISNHQQVMNSPEIIDILPSLRYICAKAECYLESHWADIISGSEDETEEEDTGKSCYSIYSRLNDQESSLWALDAISLFQQLRRSHKDGASRYSRSERKPN